MSLAFEGSQDLHYHTDSLKRFPDARRGTIAYATYVAPIPANSGERIRAVNLIKAIRSLGYRVEAVVGNYDDIDLGAQSGPGICYQPIALPWPSLTEPSIYFRARQAFLDQVIALHHTRRLTAVILDYGFLGAHIAPLSRLNVPIILGTHNQESALTGQRSASSLRKRASDRLQQAIEFAHERIFFAAADALLCVSDADRHAYARYVPPERIFVLPNFVDVPDTYGSEIKQPRIMMTGSFDNFQNRAGLDWFIREVWDDSLRARTQLCVAGKQSERAVAAYEDRRIDGLGSRDDLLIEIARSQCAIVPLRHGAGTRLKCVEAMAVRTPIVTTAKGCEGIEHEGAFFVADDVAAFRAALHQVLDDPQKARSAADKARQVFDRRYSLAANSAILERVLAFAARHTTSTVR